MKEIYFDHIAATPLSPEVREAMYPFFAGHFGNAQSRHPYGKVPRAALEAARGEIARLIHGEPEEIFFTSSGSESNNLAVKGVAQAYAKRGRHIVASVIEHHSVINPVRSLERQGYQVTWIPVDGNGLVDPGQVEASLGEQTVLLSVMMANNEIGTIEPILRLGEIAQAREVPFHTDAVAAAGMIPIDVQRLGVDLLSLAAPTFGGPKGAAALYVRRGTRILPLIEGGIQEEGRRSGTENVAAVVGMGVAAAAALRQLPWRRDHLIRLRDLLQEGLGKIRYLRLTGDLRQRLPHVVSFCAEYVDGEALVRTLADEGIFAASGSSCTSYALKISPVLTAMGIPANVAQGGVVISLGIENTLEEVQHFLAVFPGILDRLRSVSPLYSDARRKEGEL